MEAARKTYVLHVTETAIAKRFELANERILARDAIVRRTLLECKASWLSMLQRGICLLQMFHQPRSDITRLTYEYPLASV
jgi:hypothetical protein